MPARYPVAITRSGLTIYEPIAVGNPDLWIPTPHLEALLERRLIGESLAGLPLRTRSKVVKALVCEALGYPVPRTFAKTQPRFPGQNLDVYTQKADNLQIWNEEVSSERRYALIKVDEQDVVTRVRVVHGTTIGELDTTGTLTTKYQARLDVGPSNFELISPNDTPAIVPHVQAGAKPARDVSPVAYPQSGLLIPIAEVFQRLRPLVGKSFPDTGFLQDRNRGAALHSAVCAALGYRQYEDCGQFPDVRQQLLEVKLQTSPTIDLGLVLPNSTEPMDMPAIRGHVPRHCDTRYAVFYATTDGKQVTVQKLYCVTGAQFFERFRRFEGKVQNAKIQIPLPRGFFGR